MVSFYSIAYKFTVYEMILSKIKECSLYFDHSMNN